MPDKRSTTRQLLLLRHAKSSWDDPSLSDHERPLSKRGHKAATAMRHLMRAKHLVPDLVIVSDARRTLETLAALQPWDSPPAIDTTGDLYLASAEEMLEVLRRVGAKVRSVLLIGHNPGMQELALLLEGGSAEGKAGKLVARVAKSYPTGALAEFALSTSWSEIDAGTGRLTRFVTPREL